MYTLAGRKDDLEAKGYGKPQFEPTTGTPPVNPQGNDKPRIFPVLNQTSLYRKSFSLGDKD